MLYINHDTKYNKITETKIASKNIMKLIKIS